MGREGREGRGQGKREREGHTHRDTERGEREGRRK